MLSGKVAVVTGAASKLGRAIATRFVEQGASVILADTNINLQQPCFQSLLAALNRKGRTNMAHAMDCDVRNPSNILDAVNEAKKIYDRDVDIFYNNAGVENLYRPYSAIDMSCFKNAVAVNVESVIASINHAGDVMRKSKSGAGGCILCTGSTVGALCDVMPSWYSISKAAVVGVVRTTAAELGSHGVRVNAISPHDVVANFERDVLWQIFPQATDRQLDDTSSRYSVNKVSVDDVANAAVYLASDDGKRSNQWPRLRAQWQVHSLASERAPSAATSIGPH